LPLLTSVPDALPLNITTPGAVALYDHANTVAELPAITSTSGSGPIGGIMPPVEPVVMNNELGETLAAEDCPLFATTILTVTCCPTFKVVAPIKIVLTSETCDCTVIWFDDAVTEWYVAFVLAS
jgi:hypothetical protein